MKIEIEVNPSTVTVKSGKLNLSYKREKTFHTATALNQFASLAPDYPRYDHSDISRISGAIIRTNEANGVA